MNGVAAMVAVLRGFGPLTAVVMDEDIAAGVAAQGARLPHLSVSRVAANDLNLPTPGPRRQVRELVQVTAMAADYPTLHRVLALVKRAAADRLYPAIDGISGVTIHTAGAGPDFTDDQASIYLGSQDFAVIYNEEL